MDFRGPMGFRKAVAEGPWTREGTHPNDTEKSVCEAWRPLFFGDHIIFRTKLQHFLRLFWTSQNRKSVIFELAPGPLLVPGGTGCMQLQSCYKNYFLDIKSVACLIITKRSVSELGSSRRAAWLRENASLTDTSFLNVFYSPYGHSHGFV